MVFFLRLFIGSFLFNGLNGFLIFVSLKDMVISARHASIVQAFKALITTAAYDT